eukprot:CAMPEP_0167825496 /NCGR_PEP_ID=MMETSP0112_2-20121227/9409_1 /TAXON_ID=91324 /ORGANISM="Lotharella globosa, Strain CCCM811" /LENGTH=138 /DNA_ID=CAMNT_0007727631 /DNA_START=12 /DNA_END=428 /DNA_ORIENTATION=-
MGACSSGEAAALGDNVHEIEFVPRNRKQSRVVTMTSSTVTPTGASPKFKVMSLFDTKHHMSRDTHEDFATTKNRGNRDLELTQSPDEVLKTRKLTVTRLSCINSPSCADASGSPCMISQYNDIFNSHTDLDASQRGHS